MIKADKLDSDPFQQSICGSIVCVFLWIISKHVTEFLPVGKARNAFDIESPKNKFAAYEVC